MVNVKSLNSYQKFALNIYFLDDKFKHKLLEVKDIDFKIPLWLSLG